ncbi:hypothetical protein A6A07_13605 [Streptomyces sp. CB03911]|nr:hypothetical protein A6A07_13605 [Streptomyces sp. CB03911]
MFSFVPRCHEEDELLRSVAAGCDTSLMQLIPAAIAALPRPAFNAMDYPVGYAAKLLRQHADLVPYEHRARAEEDANTPTNSRGKPRAKSADRGFVLWHAFRYWCQAEGDDVSEMAVLLAEEYMARSGIVGPPERRGSL